MAERTGSKIVLKPLYFLFFLFLSLKIPTYIPTPPDCSKASLLPLDSPDDLLFAVTLLHDKTSIAVA